MLFGRSFAARLVSAMMPDTRTSDLIYSTLHYYSDFPAKQLLLLARPAGFEPAAGGLEVPGNVFASVRGCPESVYLGQFRIDPVRQCSQTFALVTVRSRSTASTSQFIEQRQLEGSREGEDGYGCRIEGTPHSLQETFAYTVSLSWSEEQHVHTIKQLVYESVG